MSVKKLALWTLLILFTPACTFGALVLRPEKVKSPAAPKLEALKGRQLYIHGFDNKLNDDHGSVYIVGHLPDGDVQIYAGYPTLPVFLYDCFANSFKAAGMTVYFDRDAVPSDALEYHMDFTVWTDVRFEGRAWLERDGKPVYEKELTLSFAKTTTPSTEALFAQAYNKVGQVVDAVLTDAGFQKALQDHAQR